MKLIKLVLYFLAFVFFWLFINGFGEMAKAPKYLDSCQKISWAQAQNKNDFRPDEWLALWILKKNRCEETPEVAVSSDLDKNPLATVYVCYLLSHDHASESEIVLLENVIGYANSSNSSHKSTELIQYALDRVEGMDADKQNFFMIMLAKIKSNAWANF